jgi:hypothetical protein
MQTFLVELLFLSDHAQSESHHDRAWKDDRQEKEGKPSPMST